MECLESQTTYSFSLISIFSYYKQLLSYNNKWLCICVLTVLILSLTMIFTLIQELLRQRDICFVFQFFIYKNKKHCSIYTTHVNKEKQPAYKQKTLLYIYYSCQLGKTTVQTKNAFSLEPLNSVCEVSYRECQSAIIKRHIIYTVTLSTKSSTVHSSKMEV